MRIVVIDGQGGGMGKALIEALKAALGDGVELLALGTNAVATTAMLRAGAHAGATGENAIVVNAARADIILGAVGILAADAMMGELTPAIAKAVGSSDARKILLPVKRCNIEIAGRRDEPLPVLIASAVQRVVELCGEKKI